MELPQSCTKVLIYICSTWCIHYMVLLCLLFFVVSCLVLGRFMWICVVFTYIFHGCFNGTRAIVMVPISIKQSWKIWVMLTSSKITNINHILGVYVVPVRDITRNFVWQIVTYLITVKFSYNGAQFITVLHRALRLLWQKVNQILESQQTGVYCEDLAENWPRYNGTELYMIVILHLKAEI